MDKFWDKVNKSQDCWLWTGPTLSEGYGGFRTEVNGKSKVFYAHRFSWEFANGTIPNGMVVCHHCDNRKCVRLDHLFIGTVLDNNRDRDGKNRQAVGARHGKSKITDTDAKLIKLLLRLGNSKSPIADWFGVSYGCIRNIEEGKAWKHVT